MFLCAKHGKHFLSHPYLPAARMIAILCVQSIPLVCFREPFMWLVWDRPLLTVPLILSKWLSQLGICGLSCTLFLDCMWPFRVRGRTLMPFMARWMTMCMLLWVIPDSPTIQWYVSVYMHVCACCHSSIRAWVHVYVCLFVEWNPTVQLRKW